MKKCNLTPFYWCMLESFPFIEGVFHEIDNYHLLCRIVEYVNKIGNKTNELGKKVEELNNWFNSLDIQDEINNKLDEMAQDGTLARIINEDIFKELNNKINNISFYNIQTPIGGDLWYNGNVMTIDFLDNWFANAKAIGIKEIILHLIPIFDENLNNFILRYSNWDLLDEYLTNYDMKITKVKFSNTLIGSGKFPDYQVDFTNATIREKYVTFIKNELDKILIKYPTINYCSAINEASYWYSLTANEQNTDLVDMCINIINQCNTSVPTSISFAYFGDYYDAYPTLKNTLKGYGYIAINYYQMLNNANKIPTFESAEQTWKNDNFTNCILGLKNEGFNHILITETGIRDFYESMGNPVAEEGTIANGEGQARYYNGLCKLLTDFKILDFVALWYVPYININNKKVIDSFNYYTGGVRNA